jgi:NADH-quinone oxidoreductase subunit C
MMERKIMLDDQLALLKSKLEHIQDIETTFDMPSICVTQDKLIETMAILRDDLELHFEMLTDLCGVDYLDYGVDDWRGNAVSNTGFTRAKRLDDDRNDSTWEKPRFAVVYHLLSIKHNRRVRVKVYLHENSMKVPTVIPLWPSAEWFEREAYDLYGFVFKDHPDLRRLLTDYGFKGHPFRKDFPMEGHVEMIYDGEKGRCVYQPVTIHARVNIPKVIRKDNRYLSDEGVAKETSDA